MGFFIKRKRESEVLNKMLEYISFGAMGVGAGVAVGQYFFDKMLKKEHDRVCEENERIFNEFDYKIEISRLINCLNNYLDLRISADE